MTSNTHPDTRKRDAKATRSAILASARSAFAKSGYDGAGVREIAAGAGVTAMMINRYFGSKEGLFAEVVAETMAEPTILVPEILDSAMPGREIARALVAITQAGETPLDGFLISLHSASSARAAEIGREQIEAGHHRTMMKALSGKHASERAAIILAIVSGVQAMRQLIALPALANADPNVLVDLLTPLFARLIAD